MIWKKWNDVSTIKKAENHADSLPLYFWAFFYAPVHSCGEFFICFAFRTAHMLTALPDFLRSGSV